MTAHSLIRPLTIVVAVTALLLAIPLIAMQFTQEVNWSAGDFAAGALLLLTTGSVIVLGMRSEVTARAKAVIVAAALLTLLLVWAHLAVGLFS